MPTTKSNKRVVADRTLGKLLRRFWELITRVKKGSVDSERALVMMQYAIEGVPEAHESEGSSWGTYLLESEWSWDNSHQEFATINIEKCDVEEPFESILVASEEIRAKLLKYLTRVFDAQVPSHGSHNMLRLYRVVNRRCFGYNPSDHVWHTYGPTGHDDTTKTRHIIEYHFFLKPICDFDADGNPIPCQFGEN